MEHKDIVIDNDAIVNTAQAELETEPAWIPQGEKPELNPNPGYGDNGETKPALVTNLVEGEHVQPSDEFERPEGAKVVKERTNFVGGLFVKGKEVVPGEGESGGETKLYNFYDLSSYGGIEEDEPLPGISAAELFELIDSTYDPKKPTVIYCKSGDYDVTLNCTVVHDAVAQVPSYLIIAGDGTYYYEFTISRLDKSIVIAD